VAQADLSNQGVEDHPWIGEPAPEFDLKRVSGEAMSLSGLEGKIVVIHFGASW
jgi:peroxiredoxin